MSDHLPECYLSGPPSLCPMCEALRACEARLEDEWLRSVDDAWRRGHDTGFRIGVMRGEHGASSN